jgi:myo-inositol 2-dehydrogenase/D-chiro-inositol 1-dehydrogenase
MAKLGIGVVGIGEMGRRHAENLRRNVPGARLIAVADVSEERARQTAMELELDLHYNSIEAMLENKEIDAVLIATPD